MLGIQLSISSWEIDSVPFYEAHQNCRQRSRQHFRSMSQLLQYDLNLTLEMSLPRPTAYPSLGMQV